MAQQFDYPKTEQELRGLLDDLYRTSLEGSKERHPRSFKGLLEIMSSEVVILTAIHNIKGNAGSNTPGSDGETIRVSVLEKEYPMVIQRVQNQFKYYTPQPVRRVFIPKPGKQEKRPLGIPSIVDRIVQECIRRVLEPILEAQFFAHSYGFRPMRDAQMAMERAEFLCHNTRYHWVIEGDISKFFDTVNHTVLLKKLYGMGIHDQRVLMIIKAMLKAGIMGEMQSNPLGTPQGGIISPLLANAYLNTLDQWIAREWERKKTRHAYTHISTRFEALRTKSNLKPAYLVRYADDWVLITNTRSNAVKWKQRISRFLETQLKLTLSDEKTLITNVRNRRVHFLGYDLKLVRGDSQNGWITRTYPNEERLKRKVAEIRITTRKMRKMTSLPDVVHQINLVNSQLRGLCNYFQSATWVNPIFKRYSRHLQWTAHYALRRHGGQWIAANQLHNLIDTHRHYATRVPGIQFNEMNIGITRLSFVRWTKKSLKNQDETPFTSLGRELYSQRVRKKARLTRADDILSLHLSKMIADGRTSPLYNFEYFLNRAYALNRDRGTCRVCGWDVHNDDVHIHHAQPWLPIHQVNRVPHLVTVHEWCHQIIHDGIDHSSELGDKAWRKVLELRRKLVVTN